METSSIDMFEKKTKPFKVNALWYGTTNRINKKFVKENRWNFAGEKRSYNSCLHFVIWYYLRIQPHINIPQEYWLKNFLLLFYYFLSFTSFFPFVPPGSYKIIWIGGKRIKSFQILLRMNWFFCRWFALATLALGVCVYVLHTAFVG